MNKNVVLIALTAGTLLMSGAESVKNLYANHELQTYAGKNGTIQVRNHWYQGKILEAGKKDGKNAIKFQSIPAGKGNFNAALSGYAHIDKLPPGKYSMSVQCLVEPGEKVEDVQYFHVSLCYKSEGKTRFDSKKYTGAAKPVPGKWFEMKDTFEITAGKSNHYFLFGHFGKSPVTVWYAAPSIKKVEE